MGPEGFESFYLGHLGGRWESLKNSFGKDTQYSKVEFEGMAPYFLDKASFLAANQLELKKDENFLDMCSAPGGKALCLLQRYGKDVHFLLNDVSNTRRLRLLKVLKEHVPLNFREHVKLSGQDGKKPYAFGNEGFDKILLDAPCSSERHVWQAPKHLKEWSSSRAQRLAKEQWGLIKTALKILKPGGHLLYSTCALNPAENDGIIEKAKERFSLQIEVEKITLEEGEATTHGWQIWPDVCEGMGPIYMARIFKSA